MSVDPLAFLGAAPPPPFPPSSRYHGVDVASHTLPDGRVVTHLRRRFLPRPESLATFQENAVSEGERLDQLAARHLGDPALYWKICDANLAFRPDDLTATPGRVLRLALPEGLVPPPPHA
jgi:hypothetical protein